MGTKLRSYNLAVLIFNSSYIVYEVWKHTFQWFGASFWIFILALINWVIIEITTQEG
jgi:hypothetical protein